MKQVILKMNVNGQPFRQQLGLRAALQKVIEKSLKWRVDNVTIYGRAAL